MIEKILVFLKKLSTPPALCIISAVLGLAFILLPTVALDVLLIIVGVLVTGYALLTLSTRNGSSRDISYILSIVHDVSIAIFGITIITTRSRIAGTLSSIFGVYILVKSIVALTRLFAIHVRDRKWWLTVILYIILSALGLWMLVYPIFANILSGVALLLLSLNIYLTKIKGSGGRNNGDGNIYDPYFEDKT